MVDVRGDVLRPPHGTTPAAVKADLYVMERLFRRVYCNPTEPLNPNPTSDRQLFFTSPKEEEKGENTKPNKNWWSDIKSTKMMVRSGIYAGDE